MHHPTDRIPHTTAFVTPVVEYWLEREIAQWIHSMKSYLMTNTNMKYSVKTVQDNKRALIPDLKL